MTQQEFLERTKVQLSAEEYQKVEMMYLATQMDKDEFCKEWLKHRNNSLVKELYAAYETLDGVNHDILEQNKDLDKEIALIKQKAQEEEDRLNFLHLNRIKEFARHIILTGGNPNKIYDVIEEELGIGFIIKTKLEQDIELEESEKHYLINKL